MGKENHSKNNTAPPGTGIVFLDEVDMRAEKKSDADIDVLDEEKGTGSTADLATSQAILAEGGWQCMHCTLMNRAHMTVCAVCDSTRGGTIGAPLRALGNGGGGTGFGLDRPNPFGSNPLAAALRDSGSGVGGGFSNGTSAEKRQQVEKLTDALKMLSTQALLNKLKNQLTDRPPDMVLPLEDSTVEDDTELEDLPYPWECVKCLGQNTDVFSANCGECHKFDRTRADALRLLLKIVSNIDGDFENDKFRRLRRDKVEARLNKEHVRCAKILRDVGFRSDPSDTAFLILEGKDTPTRKLVREAHRRVETGLAKEEWYRIVDDDFSAKGEQLDARMQILAYCPNSELLTLQKTMPRMFLQTIVLAQKVLLHRQDYERVLSLGYMGLKTIQKSPNERFLTRIAHQMAQAYQKRALGEPDHNLARSTTFAEAVNPDLLEGCGNPKCQGCAL